MYQLFLVNIFRVILTKGYVYRYLCINNFHEKYYMAALGHTWRRTWPHLTAPSRTSITKNDCICYLSKCIMSKKCQGFLNNVDHPRTFLRLTKFLLICTIDQWSLNFLKVIAMEILKVFYQKFIYRKKIFSVAVQSLEMRNFLTWTLPTLF